jgi:2',3'-cyclic-nucleotide 2'-phosphodiesterase (5'-nucleotidase family)
MITLLHTNDLHGHLAALPRLAALIGRERARDPDALLLDAGDLGLRGATADLGVQLLSALEYDAITPGNAENDFLDQRRAMGRIETSIVVANSSADALGVPTQPYLLRTVKGKHLAILGLTTPPSYQVTTVYASSHPFRQLEDPDQAIADPLLTARQWVPELRQRADLVIVLSHLGLWRDITLASEVPGIDLIVGGHSHHRLPQLIRMGNTWIGQAGIAGAYLGVITIEERHGEFQFTGRLEPIWQAIDPEPQTAQSIQRYLQQRSPESLAVVGATAGCWADPWRENAWANLVTDSVRRYAETDICLYKASMLMPALDPGELTRWAATQGLACDLSTARELSEIVSLHLTGAAIRAICEHSVIALPRDVDPRIPDDFDLPCNTLLHASGLRVSFDLSQPEGRRVRSLLVDDKPIDFRQRYSVATSRFLAQGYSGFHWFRTGTDHRTLETVYQVLTAALLQCQQLPALDGRLTFASPAHRAGSSSIAAAADHGCRAVADLAA